MFKFFINSLFYLCFFISSFVYGSVLEQEGRLYAKGQVIINASPEKVWEYLANDKNARNWSIFFYSISPCPHSDCPQNLTALPGDIGFIRRSHRNKDQTGVRWDEETLEIIKNKEYLYKAIRAYDFIGYGDLGNKSEHLVEQIFTRLKDNKTELIFRSSIYPFDKLSINKYEYLYIKYFFEYISRDRASLMFQKNLENIKAAVELGDQYQRVHPYEKFCDSSSWYCPKFLEDF